MTQTYSNPTAIERMRNNLCPECGNEIEKHSDDIRFWVPRLCDLLPHGVVDRIENQRRIDETT